MASRLHRWSISPDPNPDPDADPDPDPNQARSQFAFETEGSVHSQPHAGSTERVNERGLQRKLSLLAGLQAETVREERKKRQESEPLLQP